MIAVDESRVVEWLRCLIVETSETVDMVALGFPNLRVHEWSLQRISIAVLKIWSRVLSANSLWPIISIIGFSLEILATRVET